MSGGAAFFVGFVSGAITPFALLWWFELVTARVNKQRARRNVKW